jgi:hypothetical protein
MYQMFSYSRQKTFANVADKARPRKSPCITINRTRTHAFLDCSKGFDKVEYYGIFLKLTCRGVPLCVACTTNYLVLVPKFE